MRGFGILLAFLPIGWAAACGSRSELTELTSSSVGGVAGSAGIAHGGLGGVAAAGAEVGVAGGRGGATGAGSSGGASDAGGIGGVPSGNSGSTGNGAANGGAGTNGTGAIAGSGSVPDASADDAGATGGMAGTGGEIDGAAAETGAGGTGDECSETPPIAGTACVTGQICGYDFCATLGEVVAARCVSGAWAVARSGCYELGTCGIACPSGSICVQFHYGLTVTVCIPNPCGSSPLSCECAAQACAENQMACVRVGANSLDCLCATCNDECSLPCTAGEVCLETSIAGYPTVMMCAANPCGSQALSCACANALCQGGTQCVRTGPDEVFCEN